jgi:predicted dehydrogenase
VLTNIFTQRPDASGTLVPCDTWDNAVLSCVALDEDAAFPLQVEMKRIAPGEANTWSIEIDGTNGSIAYTTKLPKTLRWMEYRPGERQAWSVLDLGSQSAYPTVTGAIFESGFSDSVQQMLAAFLDELAHGRDGMRQPFYCATPAEALTAHRLYTASLESQAGDRVVALA